MGIPIRGESIGSPGEAFEKAKRRGAKRLDFLLEYARELWAFAPIYGIRADLLFVQADLETGSFTSDYYTRDGNVAGFGVPSKGPAQGLTYGAAEAAQAQVIHHCAYLGMTVSLADQLRDPRWQDVIRAGFFGTVTTTADYGNGRWAEDPDYARKLVERYTAYWGHPSQQETSPMTRPYILIVAGHRSTQDPGNPVERELTDDLAVAYTKAFREAGYTADWFQRDLDRDSNPTMTIGSLTTVAVGCRNVLASRPEPMSVMLDLHFNGAESGVHAIPPSWSPGLGAAFSGDHGNDTEANNTLDFRLARAICRNIVNATGMRLLGSDGIMRERQTGVGLNQKARLGMLSGTVGVRAKAVRMVIEHGGTNDPKRIPDFAGKCARAALAAVNAEFKVTDTPVPNPDPQQPVPPSEAYPFGMTREMVNKLFGTVTAFNPEGPVSKAWLAHGEHTGRFPELTEIVQEDDGGKYYIFSSGEIIAVEPGKDPVYVTPVVQEAA